LRKEPWIKDQLHKFLTENREAILQAMPELKISFQDARLTAEEELRIQKETLEANTLAQKIVAKLQEIQEYIRYAHENETWGKFENAVASRPAHSKAALAMAFRAVKEVKPWFKEMEKALKEINQSQVYATWSGPDYFNCFTAIDRDRKHSDFIPKSRLQDAIKCMNRHISWLRELSDNLNRQVIKLSAQTDMTKDQRLDFLLRKILPEQ
jgi:hypothetical protein